MPRIEFKDFYAGVDLRRGTRSASPDSRRRSPNQPYGDHTFRELTNAYVDEGRGVRARGGCETIVADLAEDYGALGGELNIPSAVRFGSAEAGDASAEGRQFDVFTEADVPKALRYNGEDDGDVIVTRIIDRMQLGSAQYIVAEFKTMEGAKVGHFVLALGAFGDRAWSMPRLIGLSPGQARRLITVHGVQSTKAGDDIRVFSSNLVDAVAWQSPSPGTPSTMIEAPAFALGRASASWPGLEEEYPQTPRLSFTGQSPHGVPDLVSLRQPEAGFIDIAGAGDVYYPDVIFSGAHTLTPVNLDPTWRRMIIVSETNNGAPVRTVLTTGLSRPSEWPVNYALWERTGGDQTLNLRLPLGGSRSAGYVSRFRIYALNADNSVAAYGRFRYETTYYRSGRVRGGTVTPEPYAGDAATQIQGLSPTLAVPGDITGTGADRQSKWRFNVGAEAPRVIEVGDAWLWSDAIADPTISTSKAPTPVRAQWHKVVDDVKSDLVAGTLTLNEGDAPTLAAFGVASEEEIAVDENSVLTASFGGVSWFLPFADPRP